MHERLKKLRKSLNLSRKFVAHYMGFSESVVSAVKSGQRKVTDDELAGFSKSYGVDTGELMYGKVPDNALASFLDLSEADRKEVMALMDLKRRYKNRHKVLVH